MTRYRELNNRTESFGSYFNTINGPDVPVETQGRLDGLRIQTEDVVGNRAGANPFMSLQRFVKYPHLNGDLYAWWAPDAWLRSFEDYPVQYRPEAPDPRDYVPAISWFTLQNLAWEILAKTNPSAPKVSIPTVLGELKDLPDLVRGSGLSHLARSFKGTKGNLPRYMNNVLAGVRKHASRVSSNGLLGYTEQIAQQHLSWRWGVKPMIQDAIKLMEFRRSMNDRLMELQRLASGRTLRKRCALSAATTTTSESYVYVHTQGAGIDGYTHVSSTYNMWGSAEWKTLPDSPIHDLPLGRWRDEDNKVLKPLISQFRKRALQLNYGLTDHEALATAWQLMPWSWLYDWFGGVGNIIQATNNSVGCTWGRICVMRHSRSERKVRMVPESSLASWCTISGQYVLLGELKERYPTYPSLPFPVPELPIITGGRISILASLAAIGAARRP